MYDIPRENVYVSCVTDEFHHSFVSLYLSEITKTSEVFTKLCTFTIFTRPIVYKFQKLRDIGNSKNRWLIGVNSWKL